MLSNTKQTIVEIAKDCGFFDMKAFYNVFKKQMGCPPKLNVTKPITGRIDTKSIQEEKYVY